MGKPVIASVAKDLASADALNAAIYKLADVLTVEVKVTSSEYMCELFPLAGSETEDIKVLFLREVNDQELRISIAKTTENERNLILAYAFSRTGLTGGSQ